MPALTTMRLIAVEGSPLSAISWARVGIDTRVLVINGEEESASDLSISIQPVSRGKVFAWGGGNNCVPEVRLHWCVIHHCTEREEDSCCFLS